MKKASTKGRATKVRGRTNHRVQQRTAASRGPHQEPLSALWFKDFLSQMLAVERGGEKLYRRAIDELEHEELRERLERFCAQARRHVELCEQLLEAADVEIDYRSAAAHLAEQKTAGLLGVETDPEHRDLNNLENLVLAETKDHWNWQMLFNLMDQIEDRTLRQTVRKATTEVLRQERDHLKWTNDQLGRMTMAMAHREPPAADEADPAEMAEKQSQP